MNKTNLGGISLHIEENASEKLNLYLQSVKAHFENLEGGKEIISDIEARLSEVFQENPKKGQILTFAEVDKAIREMGDPKDFSEKTHTSEFPPSPEKKRKRRLLRNPDDKVIGGVCSGLSAYFGLDTYSTRLAFFIFLLLGPGFLIYILLWLLMPAARTRVEKLEMYGKDVNISTIETFVKNPPSKSSPRKWFITGTVFGCILCMGSLWGLLGTLVGMRNAFNTIGPSGIGDPTQLANAIGSVFHYSVFGMLILPCGIIVLIFSILGLRRCKQEESAQASQH